MSIKGATILETIGRESRGNHRERVQRKPSGESPEETIGRESRERLKSRGVLVLLAGQRLQNGRLSDRCGEQLLDRRGRRERPDTARQNPAWRFRTCRPKK